MYKIYYSKKFNKTVIDVSGIKPINTIRAEFFSNMSDDEFKEIEILESDEIQELTIDMDYRKKRAREYPPMADYLDAIVNGDEAQRQKYINDCLAVKAKYPKP